MTMKLAIWNAPFLAFIRHALEQSEDVDVMSGGVEEVLSQLATARADAALIPADIALMATDNLENLPAVAVSTWSNPYATATLSQGFLSSDLVISHGPDAALYAFVTAVVLKEHYGIKSDLSPTTTVPDDRAPHEIMTVQTGEADEGGEPRTLDLGQEWYELTNYPMVWGLFVTRKDEADPGLITRLRDIMVQIDDDRRRLIHDLTDDESYQDFVLNELRFRLDDLATASLTSMADYLYYYGRSDQVPAVQFASLPDDDEKDDDDGSGDAVVEESASRNGHGGDHE